MGEPTPSPRYSVTDLIAFGTRLLVKTGLNEAMALTVSQILVEGDTLNHHTHGLSLLPQYLEELVAGAMCKEGEPTVVSDYPAAITLDGRRLPGPALVVKALDLAIPRARTNGTCTVVIKRSHHIACLAAYHQRATKLGLIICLHSSDPYNSRVAPFGGLDPVYTPDPMSFGFPSSKEPLLIDVSTSATTSNMTARLYKEGGRLPAPWVMDADGKPSDDPAALFAERRGTILPLGGIDSGHKGFGLALAVEGLTQGLSGFGRADPKEGWGASVYLQVIDPAAFGGLDAYTRQMDHLIGACHASRVPPNYPPIRMPGERGLAFQRDCEAHGVPLHPSIMPALRVWAERLSKGDVPMPMEY